MQDRHGQLGLTIGLRGIARPLSAFAFAAALAGCGGFPDPANGPDAALLPYEKFPIEVVETVASIELPVAADQYAITEAARSEIRALGAAFREEGAATINILAPSGASNSVSAIAAAADISRALGQAGVDQSLIRIVPYAADPQIPSPPVVVSYMRYEATSPRCGDFSMSLAQDYNNVASPNFGCAYQANMAAMIANPRDLIEPRGETPVDATRRSVVIDKYRKGEVTNTATRTPEEAVQASDVFQ